MGAEGRGLACRLSACLGAVTVATPADGRAELVGRGVAEVDFEGSAARQTDSRTPDARLREAC